MRVNLAMLENTLRPYHPVILKKPAEALRVRNISMAENETSFRQENIYLCSPAEAEKYAPQSYAEHLTFLVVCREEEECLRARELAAINQTADFVFLHTTERPAVIRSTIERKLSEWDNWYYELTDAIMTNQSIGTQLEIVSRIFRNPIALFDTAFSLIAWAGTLPEHFEDPVWECVTENGYNTTATFPPHILRQLAECTQPGVHVVPPLESAGEFHYVTASLTHDGDTAAILAMDEVAGTITEGELFFLRLVKDCLEHSSALLQELAVSRGSSSSLFLRLVNGTAEAPQLQRFLEERRWKNHVPYRLYKINSALQEFTPQDLNSYLRMIASAAPQLELFICDNSIIAVERGAGNTFSGVVLWTRVFTRVAFCVGVSMVFDDYARLHEAYLQARIAQEHCATLNSAVIEYGAISLPHIREKLAAGDGTSYLCHPLLHRFDLRDDWHRILLDSLYRYLLYGRRLSDTAESLHIHRNTLIHRLKSIEQLLGVFPDQFKEDELLFFLLSAALLRAHIKAG